MVNIAKGCRVLMLELYKLSQKSRLDEHVLLPEQVSTILKVDLQGTIGIVEYLEQGGYIKCGHPIGKPYSWIKLTRQGMDLVMNPAQFDQAFTQVRPANSEDYALDHNAEHAATSAIPYAPYVPLPESSVTSDIENSIPLIMEALAQNDDEPLREFLSYLILQGGLDGTLKGVKSLLFAYGIEID